MDQNKNTHLKDPCNIDNLIDRLHEIIPHQEEDRKTVEPEDYLVCECGVVSMSELRESFKGSSPSLNVIQAQFPLGKACKSCIKDRDYWLKQIK